MDIEHEEVNYEKYNKIDDLVKKIFDFLINCIKSQEHTQQHAYVNIINKIVNSKYNTLLSRLEK